ncbi:MAG TPA: hypothetical protein VME46_16885 [Acidimicrobiales bacterium]|nr:hypothetical protein [Acidimicrobiales bacterium]
MGAPPVGATSGRETAAQPWPCRHHGPGTFDEQARRASHEELAVARLYQAEGHGVRTLAERRGARTADLLVCGVPVEVKSFRSVAERGGVPPSAKSVANKLLDARGQGVVAVIWATNSGLRPETAHAGYEMFCQKAADDGLEKLRAVRMVGEGWDLSRNAVLDMRLSKQSTAQPGKLVRTALEGARRERGPRATVGAPPRPRERPSQQTARPSQLR